MAKLVLKLFEVPFAAGGAFDGGKGGCPATSWTGGGAGVVQEGLLKETRRKDESVVFGLDV